MPENLYQGELVRLGAVDSQELSRAFMRWGRDSEYVRLMDNDPPVLWSAEKYRNWLEKEYDPASLKEFLFTIHTLADDRLVGCVALGGFEWSHGEAWMSIGIGERDYWGAGYGSDTLRLILDYAFHELNLHRVSLGVFGYNVRAIRAYEKVGFQREGCWRRSLLRNGERADIYLMGILRSEWS